MLLTVSWKVACVRILTNLMVAPFATVPPTFCDKVTVVLVVDATVVLSGMLVPNTVCPTATPVVLAKFSTLPEVVCALVVRLTGAEELSEPLEIVCAPLKLRDEADSVPIATVPVDRVMLIGVSINDPASE